MRCSVGLTLLALTRVVPGVRVSNHTLELAGARAHVCAGSSAGLNATDCAAWVDLHPL